MRFRRMLIVVLAAVTAVASAAEAGPFPTWDKRVDGPGRFKVLRPFDDQAVFDKETGVVWQRTPSNVVFDWGAAVQVCYGVEVGGRKGWRLPTIEELMSLVDTSQSPALPAGHPFQGVLTGDDDVYWSSTTAGSNPALALAVQFAGGALVIAAKASLEPRLWCVRGGHGVDANQ
jgi:Protein of unknown function (DUF1566)